MLRGLRAGVFCVICAFVGQASAQDFRSLGLQPAQSPIGIVVVNMDRLYTDSQYGAQVAELIEERRAQLAEENRALEAELEAEAEALRVERPSLDPDVFREKADAFDAKVQKIRAERDSQEQALSDLVVASQQRFVSAVNPILARIMSERGAYMVLERPVVRLVDSSIEITDVAIAAVNAELGEGRLQVLESIE